jgi:hypothetical protein
MSRDETTREEQEGAIVEVGYRQLWHNRRCLGPNRSVGEVWRLLVPNPRRLTDQDELSALAARAAWAAWAEAAEVCSAPLQE